MNRKRRFHTRYSGRGWGDFFIHCPISISLPIYALVDYAATCKIPLRGEVDGQYQRVQVHQPRITKENCLVPFSVHTPVLSS